MRELLFFLFGNYSVKKVYYKFAKKHEPFKRKLVSIGFKLDMATIRTKKENLVIFKENFLKINFNSKQAH